MTSLLIESRDKSKTNGRYIGHSLSTHYSIVTMCKCIRYNYMCIQNGH